MSLFKQATNEQGFLKAGLLGFPGSGKTFTAAELAIGLVKLLGDKRPVFAIDTEKGFDYLTGKFKDAGVELQVARTRAFVDLIAAMKEAEASASVVIIDSVTHFWQEIQESYKREQKRTQLRVQDWGPIKGNWAQFPNLFLESRVHAILCGRAADDMDYQENEDTGKMEAYKAGTKMASEKNLGYEPGLVVEMERVNIGTLKRGKRNVVNRAHILKDRFDKLDGQSFDDPTFETFLPHIQGLNLGVHSGMAKTNSGALFAKDSDKNFYEKRKQIEILKEEVMGELTSAYPGRSADEVKAKTDIIAAAFGTRSWVALDDMTPDQLKAGLHIVKAAIAERGAKKEKQGVEA